MDFMRDESFDNQEIADYDYSKQQIHRSCEGRKRAPCVGRRPDEKIPEPSDEVPREKPIEKEPIIETSEVPILLRANLVKGVSFLQLLRLLTDIVNSTAARIKAAPADNGSETALSELKKVGTVVAGVMNDTLSGWTEIEEHTAKLSREIGEISGSAPAADRAALIATALRAYRDEAELTVFENYCPGVPEILSNYRKEVAEYKSLKGNLTTTERNLKIAWLVTKGTLSTINDVLRDWIPGVEEGEDSNQKEWTHIYEMANDKSKSFWDVAREVVISPFKIFGDTLHRFARNYGPGVSLAEDLKSDNKTTSADPSEDDNQIPDKPVEPADRRPPPGLSKSQLEQWDLFLGNQLDQDEAAMCVHDKITKENKAGVKHGKGAWKTKLPELTIQCYYELFSQWNGKDTGKRSL